jgi:hypothetical protein
MGSLLSDSVEVVERVAKDVGQLEGLPGRQRDRYRRVVNETFELLHQTVSLPINALGDLLLTPEPAAFAEKLARMGNFQAWRDLEHQVRLSRNLRAAGREMEGLGDRLTGRVAVRDWPAFKELVRRLVEGEGGFADMVFQSLYALSTRSGEALAGAAAYKRLREAVRRSRTKLEDVRLRVIRAQVRMLDTI